MSRKRKGRAEYGEGLLTRLGNDLSRQLGRGFGWRNLTSMRAFHLSSHLVPRAGGPLRLHAWLPGEGEHLQTPSAQSVADPLALSPDTFPLPWSHYVRLLSVENAEAQRFYEEEAIRGA